MDFERRIHELQRRLDADPEDRGALEELENFRARVFGIKPAVDPNKRYGHSFSATWKRFYVKGFVAQAYFPGTMRAHIRSEAGKEPVYVRPNSGFFDFDDKTGQVLWRGDLPQEVLFEWTESLLDVPLRQA